MAQGNSPVRTGSVFFDTLLLQVETAEAPREAAPSSWIWSAEVPGTVRAQGVREACREYLLRYAEPDDYALANAELIVAELVANVERHAPGPASFHLDWNDRNPRLLVLDRGPGFPLEVTTALPEPFAESGRGLAIINLLAVEHKFGNRPDGGAYVCVVLPVERAHGE